MAREAAGGHPLAGRSVIVTAGGTVERIDPVRYITNDSSGKMGIAIAEAARDLGADVTLIAARVTAELPAGVEVVRVESAEDMLRAVMERFDAADVVVKAAAVADYQARGTPDVQDEEKGRPPDAGIGENARHSRGSGTAEDEAAAHRVRGGDGRPGSERDGQAAAQKLAT